MKHSSFMIYYISFSLKILQYHRNYVIFNIPKFQAVDKFKISMKIIAKFSLHESQQTTTTVSVITPLCPSF